MAHILLVLVDSLSSSGRSKHGPLILKVRVKQEEMWGASITL